eukprot:gene9990-2309_t
MELIEKLCEFNGFHHLCLKSKLICGMQNKQLVHKFQMENRLKSSPWGNVGCQQWHTFTYGDPGEVFVQKSFGTGAPTKINLFKKKK